MDNITTNPQIQNPAPNMSQMPSLNQTPQMPVAGKKTNMWFWLVLGLIAVIGLGAWWYIGQMVPEEPIVQQPQIDTEAREDTIMNREINDTDLGSIDSEFQSVDKDLNSL